MQLTLQEFIQLLFDRSSELPLNHQANVLMLVLFGDGNVATIRNEIDSVHNTKLVIINREGFSDDVGDVVLKHPDERLVVVWIKRFHILERDKFAQDALVHCSTEMAIQNTTLVKSLADDATDKFEEHKMLLIDTTQLIGVESSSVGRHRNEESIAWVEHLP